MRLAQGLWALPQAQAISPNMYLCYIDESGTALDPSVDTFVLLGVAIPASLWKSLDSSIISRKSHYGIEKSEMHTGWMLRRYAEQEKVADFASLSREDRRREVNLIRKARLLSTQALRPDRIQNLQKYHRKTDAYIHLTLDERKAAVFDVARIFSGAVDARIFGQAVDKNCYKRSTPMFEFSFERLVERFQAFLHHRSEWAEKICLERDRIWSDC